MAEQLVLSTRDGAVAQLTLNRPEARNALDPPMAGDLVAAIAAASSDPTVRVIVLTGAGSAFCAGAKLDGLLSAAEGADPDAVRAYFGAIEQIYRSILGARPPTIAMVNGHALAGGCGIVTACDVAIAAEDAQFGYPEVQLGLAPGMAMTLLFRQTGFRAGLELCLTGRRFGAREARALGLVNRVTPRDALESSVAEMAAQLTALSPSALAAVKRAAWTLPDLDLPLALAQALDVSTLCALSPDARDGMARFVRRGRR